MAGPSVAKAFGTAIWPWLEERGFIKVNNKSFVRVVDGWVLQYVLLEVRGTLRREFRLPYSAMLLAEPASFFTGWTHSEFTKGSGGGFYGAMNERALARSMERVRIACDAEFAPWLETTDTVAGLADAVREYGRARPAVYDGGPVRFTLACAASLLGDVADALRYLEELEERRAPTEPRVPVFDRLRAALEGGEDRVALHEAWRRETLEALGLPATLV